MCSPRYGTDGYLIHPPTDLATPSNLEGEFWLLLNLIDLCIKVGTSNWTPYLEPLTFDFRPLNSFIRASLHGEAWTVLSIAHPQPFPKRAGDEAPEEYKETVAPIDDAYATAMLEGTDDFACHRLDLHQQWIAGIAQ